MKGTVHTRVEISPRGQEIYLGAPIEIMRRLSRRGLVFDRNQCEYLIRYFSAEQGELKTTLVPFGASFRGGISPERIGYLLKGNCEGGEIAIDLRQRLYDMLGSVPGPTTNRGLRQDYHQLTGIEAEITFKGELDGNEIVRKFATAIEDFYNPFSDVERIINNQSKKSKKK